MRWLALDIGGANLKASDGKGFANSVRFPLWKRPENLSQELRTLIAQAGDVDHLAATITGELADCFANKKEGIDHILKAFEEAASGRHTRVYLKDGSLVSPAVARGKEMLAAASNWHALARFGGRFARRGPALLIDVGSTTCDIVPLLDGEPSHVAVDDTDRLIAGELVYSGIERSPVGSVSQAVPYRGRICPLAHEVFATMLDVYILLGDHREDSANKATADGRAATKANCRARLGRSVCADGDSFHHKDAVAMAEAIASDQTEKLARAVRQVVDRQGAPPQTIILSGHGPFLARRAIAQIGLHCRFLSLADDLSPEISRSAAAHALAVLAREASEQ